MLLIIPSVINRQSVYYIYTTRVGRNIRIIQTLQTYVVNDLICQFLSDGGAESCPGFYPEWRLLAPYLTTSHFQGSTFQETLHDLTFDLRDRKQFPEVYRTWPPNYGINVESCSAIYRSYLSDRRQWSGRGRGRYLKACIAHIIAPVGAISHGQWLSRLQPAGAHSLPIPSTAHQWTRSFHNI